MEKGELKSWWRKEGCRKLNSVMVELAGNKIGYVPIENLLSEICQQEYLLQQEELIQLLIKDGATLRCHYTTNNKLISIDIWIK